MDEDLREEDFINQRDRFNEAPRTKKQTIDRLVSDIVGRDISTTDPRLIKLIAKWKQAKGDDETPDNFLEQEDKITELKETFYE